MSVGAGEKILLLEDDLMIASGLLYALEQEGYQTTHAKTVAEAKAAIRGTLFDPAILDMQLPDGFGTEVQDSLGKTGTPVIFLTVIDDEANTVRAFENGAADYITKPFRLRELIARIKRTLLQNSTGGTHGILRVGNVSIDVDAGKVFIGDKQINLTALEYRLLLIFATNQGQLLTRARILDDL